MSYYLKHLIIVVTISGFNIGTLVPTADIAN